MSSLKLQSSLTSFDHMNCTMLEAMASGSDMATADTSFADLLKHVLKAVLEVVVMCFPGYLIAKMGNFPPQVQKMVSNANVSWFTPCLIFFKVASRLDRDELKESLAVAIVWVLQVFFSAAGAYVLSRLSGLHKRGTYFVLAMAIFGNANSLPISLIVSLSKTLPNLRWHMRPNDSPDEVAARGIIYLIINQQLGQMLRWSLGVNTLLAPAKTFTAAEGGPDATENGLTERGRREWQESQSLLNDSTTTLPEDPMDPAGGDLEASNGISTSGTVTPNFGNGNSSSVPMTNGAPKPLLERQSTDWRSPRSIARTMSYQTRKSVTAASESVDKASGRVYDMLPPWLQAVARVLRKICAMIYSLLNAPLLTTFFALFVVCIPPVKAFFFTKDTWVNTSVTTAIEMSGNAAIPLTLFVLGANLANTPSQEEQLTMDRILNKRLVILSLVSRMLLPLIFAAPVLALIAKYASVSVVDDPTFVVVAFLLIGAPPALQMSQICQLNDVYLQAMSQLLVWGYVILIVPTTVLQVVMGIEVIKWAGH